MMKIGTAKQIINPQMEVRLCGYANRPASFESIREDIWLRVQIQNHEEQTILFLYGDILWWGSDFVAMARQRIRAEFGYEPEQVFFVASHNHSGPPTGNCFTKQLETFNEAYADWLHKQILEGILRAQQDMEEAEVRLFAGESHLNVFRRVMEEGKIKMKPNYHVPVDHGLHILGYFRKDGSLKGSMVHYACHANLSCDNVIQPDFPGLVLQMLDQKYPGSVSVFLQGCTGDTRPNSVLGDDFISCEFERVQTFAGAFYKDCIRTLAGEGILVQPKMEVKRKLVQLPVENRKSEEDLKHLLETGDVLQKEWAKKILEKHNQSFETLEISRIIYGNVLDLYLFNAEVSQYYAAFAKEICPGALSVAYTNGMIGYLCTAEQIGQGGYEPEGSAVYFALSGTYSRQIEAMIHKTMREVSQ